MIQRGEGKPNLWKVSDTMGILAWKEGIWGQTASYLFSSREQSSSQGGPTGPLDWTVISNSNVGTGQGLAGPGRYLVGRR